MGSTMSCAVPGLLLVAVVSGRSVWVEVRENECVLGVDKDAVPSFSSSESESSSSKSSSFMNIALSPGRTPGPGLNGSGGLRGPAGGRGGHPREGVFRFNPKYRETTGGRAEAASDPFERECGSQMVTGAAGDWDGAVAKLKSELRKAEYPANLDEKSLRKGDPGSLLPVLHYALLSYSQAVASELLRRGHDLASKSDLRFAEGVIRALVDVFSYRPMLLPGQLLAAGFAERKAQLAADVLQMCREWHLQHSRMQQHSRARTTSARLHALAHKRSRGSYDVSERSNNADAPGTVRVIRPNSHGYHTAYDSTASTAAYAVRSLPHSSAVAANDASELQDYTDVVGWEQEHGTNAFQTYHTNQLTSEQGARHQLHTVHAPAMRNSSSSLQGFFTRAEQPRPNVTTQTPGAGTDDNETDTDSDSVDSSDDHETTKVEDEREYRADADFSNAPVASETHCASTHLRGNHQASHSALQAENQNADSTDGSELLKPSERRRTFVAKRTDEDLQNITKDELANEVDHLQLEVDKLRDELVGAKEQIENQSAHITVLESRVKMLEGANAQAGAKKQHDGYTYEGYNKTQQQDARATSDGHETRMSSKVKELVDGITRKNQQTQHWLQSQEHV